MVWSMYENIIKVENSLSNFTASLCALSHAHVQTFCMSCSNSLDVMISGPLAGWGWWDWRSASWSPLGRWDGLQKMPWETYVSFIWEEGRAGVPETPRWRGQGTGGSKKWWTVCLRWGWREDTGDLVQWAMWKGRRWQRGKNTQKVRREYDFRGNLQ